MTYQETVKYLFASTPVFEHIGASAYKEGLGTTKALDEHFGHPHTRFLSIHVAGTNGKGSCSHTLAAILQAEGYKVGLYTSPHLVDFRERIRVNGQMIPEQEVIDFVEQERSFFEPLHPSFFELTTALAFKYFAEQKVDIAVIEVGLGGRLDCTNIITPVLSIITNISLDHTQFLGNTLAAIAGEKAGIIKQGVPVIIGEAVPETKAVFLAKAQKMDALIVFAEDIPAVCASHALPTGGIAYRTRFFGNITGELGGSYQEKNANTVLTAAMLLYNKGVIRNTDSIARGFADVCEATGLMGRWQKLQDRPLVICDTGHNEEGIRYVTEGLRALGRPLRIIFGMVSDKDITSALSSLPPEATYYFTEASVPRAMPAGELLRLATECGLKGRAFPTLASALETAKAEQAPQDVLFVGGSNFLVADLLEYQSTHKL